MAAPKGNQFWKLRSKHGRDTLFSTPEMLWEAACEYFEWCDKKPWEKSEAIKSGDKTGKIIKVPTQRPYSMSGLCLYLGCNQSYFYQFKEKCSEDFSYIITRVEDIIETQQFEGAVVGAFSQNIITRKLGLAEKKEVDTNMNIRSSLEALSDEELQRIIDGTDIEDLNISRNE